MKEVRWIEANRSFVMFQLAACDHFGIFSKGCMHGKNYTSRFSIWLPKRIFNVSRTPEAAKRQSAAYWTLDSLVYKKLSFGFPHYLRKLIKDSLSNKVFFVQLRHNSSTIKDIKARTLQGSILGPLIFSIYTAVQPASMWTRRPSTHHLILHLCILNWQCQW